VESGWKVGGKCANVAITDTQHMKLRNSRKAAKGRANRKVRMEEGGRQREREKEGKRRRGKRGASFASLATTFMTSIQFVYEAKAAD